jgi:hypothetical protein
VLFAFLGGVYIGPTPVSAETLVRQAQEIHNLPVDRCYLVVSRPEPGAADRFPLLAQPRETHLWTRGDRFWMESALPGKRWKWGRDDRHRVWVTRSRDEGVRFEADEVPEGLGVACDVLGLHTETLLDVLLKDFDLRRETSPGTGVHRVHAELKPGHTHPGLESATLEIDAESKVLRHAVLVRAVHGVRVATVTGTLVETCPQSDSRYELEGHLDDGAVIYSRDHQPLRRLPLLLRFLPAPPGRPLP